jgi:ABC-type uncharacterized transport system substrate-binding protein
MRRRDFVALLGGLLFASPAQGQLRTRKVGFLHPGQATNVNARLSALREGLIEPEPHELAIELVTRLADGNLSRLPSLAAELVANRVEAVVAAGPPAVRAARGATASIPVVAIDLETDPVASGLLASLARPGGNVTGVFLDFPDFSAKCLQLLSESIPKLTIVGVLWDPTTGELQLQAVRAAAEMLKLHIEIFQARHVADIADVFYAIDPARIEGVLILSSPLFGGNPETVADLALRRKVPTISLFPETAKKGGLLAYGPDVQALYRQVGTMARKVLHGGKPTDMPAERPTRFELVANLRTANKLGITLPNSILLRADEVIE